MAGDQNDPSTNEDRFGRQDGGKYSLRSSIGALLIIIIIVALVIYFVVR